MDANSVATHMTPPEISWENAPRGEKASEKRTTTSRAKKSMELTASRERHSMRRSLTRWVQRERVIGPGPLGLQDLTDWICGLPPLCQEKAARMGHPIRRLWERLW